MAVLSFLRGLKSGSVFRVRFMSEMTSSKVKSASIANNKRNQQHIVWVNHRKAIMSIVVIS
jgi:Na+-transporting methylmalonyl-CoA/oxaloacetate decarboxylase gamma subunit